MRFGIVGAGMIAEFHARAIKDMAGAELSAVYARRPEAAQDFAARHACAAYTDLDEFLADGKLDIVTICTPSGAHLEPTVAAARSGTHVICEKPLEVTSERVDRMIAACDSAGVTLAGIFPRRFNQATRLLKAAVDSGRFGRIAIGDASVNWWRPQSYYDSGVWRGTWQLDGGGALMNQSIHTIDLLLHVMGDVTSVSAETRLIAHEGIEVEDTATALLTFANGALGTLQGSTACWSAKGHPAEIRISGDKGSVFMTDDRFRVWEFADETSDDADIRREFNAAGDAGGAGAADPAAIDFSWHRKNFEDVVEAIRDGRPPAIDGREARRAVHLIETIYRSARNGGSKERVTG